MKQGKSAEISVEAVIAAPIEKVWEELARIERHPEWMADARSLRFVGDARQGPGTTVVVETRIGPFRTRDLVEFTQWEPPLRMGVSHRGAVSGTGLFELEAIRPHETLIRWQERLHFPWFLAGRIGAVVARPLLARTWRRNLSQLARRF